MVRRCALRLVAPLAGLLVATSAGAAPSVNGPDVYTVVHAFDAGTDGSFPQTSLLDASDGNLYGTTWGGGLYGGGTIYRLAPDGTETVLHHFNVRVDGDHPSALIEATDGNFYGTALQDVPGPGPFGFLFRMAPDGTFTTLHAFSCGADGAFPAGALVQGEDGNFYGMTLGLSTNYCSAGPTVFRMTPEGTVSIVHALRAGTEGTELSGSLIQGRDGNFYGMASAGGPRGGGTVFRVSPAGELTVLHAFRSYDTTEGYWPLGPLLEVTDGNFYGITSQGGRCLFCGTIFRISPSGVFDVMYAFQADSEIGNSPRAGLAEGADGRLYGTTATALFQLTPDGALSVLHVLNRETDGLFPEAVLHVTADETIYGTTRRDGPALRGTVFRLGADGRFEVIYAFPGPEGGASPSVLVQGLDGHFYGRATAGGVFNRGTIFRLEDDGTVTTLHAFEGAWDGSLPTTLIQAEDGTLYGLTARGGASDFGTLFSLTTDGDFTVLYSFAGDPSVEKTGSRGLVQGQDGAVYGVSGSDGAYRRGALFRWTADEGLTILYSFGGGDGNGTRPYMLKQAADGSLYGITLSGGVNGYATIFQWAPNGTVTTIVDDFGCNVGPFDMIPASDGDLYLDRCNAIVRVTPDGTVTVVHTFSDSLEGYSPEGLMQAADGHLYGVASLGGGPNARGTAFRLTLDGGFTVLHTFMEPGGLGPAGAPIQGSDGALYGTTFDGGGPNKEGVVWRLCIDGFGAAQKVRFTTGRNALRRRSGRRDPSGNARVNRKAGSSAP